MQEQKKFCVIIGGERIDKFLSILLGFSRTKIAEFIENEALKINSTFPRKNYILKPCDEVEIFIPEVKVIDLEPDASVPFEVLFEDEFLAVVNKPQGVVVHPGAGNFQKTLVNGLVSFFENNLSEDKIRPGIVHRIDKDTSGILVIAKNNFAHQKLAEQFAIHSIKRKYICFCFGIFSKPMIRIETYIARDKYNRLKMSVALNEGKKAISIFRVLKNFSTFASKIECELETGRTHQIRVHMNYLKHSLIGDKLYQYKNYSLPKRLEFLNSFPRQALHAFFLEFKHPESGKLMSFKSPLPYDLEALENELKKLSSN